MAKLVQISILYWRLSPLVSVATVDNEGVRETSVVPIAGEVKTGILGLIPVVKVKGIN